MIFRLKKFLCIVIAGVLIAPSLLGMPADTIDTTYRPRIGLVLSGGGARGMAHIGVLKILDELRIPVDVIAGTSAGAVVGGMYASGMDVAEIEKFARDIDWKDMLNDKPSRDFRSFRKKTQENENLMGFEVGFRSWNVVFPQGVIAGQKLSFTLKAITLPVSGIQDFDALPVPYRAVATDIATGERVVLRGGNLAEAMRASMSIPGVLAPVEINGRLLVDGMFVQNLPVDVAKAMGADVIIAVDIGAPLMDRSHLNSVLGITAQVMNMVTTENVNQQAALLTNKDVLIRPDIGSVSVADYLQADAIITDGEKAARQWIPMLRRFSVSDEIYNEFRKKIHTRRKTHDRIDFIRIGKNIGQDPRIYHRLKTQPGSSLNMKTLKADLTRIYALGDFEKVDFDIVTEDTSRGLLIDGRWKSWGPNYLRFGLTMATDLEGHSSVNALADYTMSRRNQLGAEWKHLFRVGQNPTYFTEWYQPLDFKGNFFMAPYGRAQRFESGFYQQRVEIAQYNGYAAEAGHDFGISFGNAGELRAGAIWGHIDAHNTSSATRKSINAERSGIRIRTQFDMTDHPDFPKKGSIWQSEYFSSQKKWGSDGAYQTLRGAGMVVHTWDRNSIMGAFEAGSDLGTSSPIYELSELGGFLRMSGYRPGQIKGRHFGMTRFMYYRRLSAPNMSYREGLYAGFSVETGNAWDKHSQITSRDLKFSGAVVVGIDTVVGPLYLAYARAPHQEGIVYIMIGRPF